MFDPFPTSASDVLELSISTPGSMRVALIDYQAFHNPSMPPTPGQPDREVRRAMKATSVDFGAAVSVLEYRGLFLLRRNKGPFM